MVFNIPTVFRRVGSYRGERVRACITQPDAALSAYTSCGSYPLFYLTVDCRGRDEQVSCPSCATKAHEYDCYVSNVDVNWEDPDLTCENCNKRIESAYAEPEVES